MATAGATGGSAGVAATAATSVAGPVPQLVATSNVSGAGAGHAFAELGTLDPLPASSFANGDDYALGTGLSQIAPLPAKLSAVFDAAGSKVFGSAALGGNYDAEATGSQVCNSSVKWVFNDAHLTAGAPLDLGFVDSDPTGTGFAGISLTATENGKVAFTLNAATLTAANAALTDQVANLGTWTNNGHGDVDLTVSVAVTLTAPSSGLGLDMIAGVGPKNAALAEFLPLTTPERVQPTDAGTHSPATSAAPGQLAQGDGLAVRLNAATHLMLGMRAQLVTPGSVGVDTFIADAAGQTLIGGAGKDTLVGFAGDGDLFGDMAAGFQVHTIRNFVAGDGIDLTDISAASATLAYSASTGILTVHDPAASTAILLGGDYTPDGFHVTSDGHGGRLVSYLHG